MFPQEVKKENILIFLGELNQQIFEVSLIFYLLFYLLDEVAEKLISNYFNLNILLIIVIISGVILNIPRFAPEKKKEQESIKRRDYLLIVLLGIIGAGIIYYQIELLLWLRLSISIISGIIIILLSFLLLNESNDQDL